MTILSLIVLLVAIGWVESYRSVEDNELNHVINED